MPNDIFISYSRKDSEFVARLSESLTNRGIPVWIDQGGIIAGDAWRRQIVEAIRDCLVFVLVLSPNSALSDNVVKELSMAESNRKKIIPVLYQPVEIPEEMEYQLSGLQYQAFDSGDYATNLNRLLQALARLGVEIQPEKIKPIPLPAEVQSGVESPIAGVREGTVDELSRILNGRNVGLALAAQEALKQLSNDDSRRVANSAKQVLQEYAARTQAQESQAEKERLVREKTEQDKLAQAKIEQDRLAREKAEQERLAQEKAEQERLEREQAEAVRVAREQEEQAQLARQKSQAAITISSSKQFVPAKPASRNMTPILIGGGVVGVIVICMGIMLAFALANAGGQKPPTAVPQIAVVPTAVPSTAAVPTAVPPTAIPPTAVPPTVAPTAIPSTAIPPTVAPTAIPPTVVPPTVAPTAIPPTTVPSTVMLFEDQFNGSTIDSSKWNRDNNTGNTADVSNGTLRLSSSGRRFPYIYTRSNPIPTQGDFRVTLRFRYLNIGVCGAPMAMTSFFLPSGLSQTDTNKISASAEASGLSIWFWHEVIFYRAGSETPNIPLPGSPTAWHEVVTEYSNNRYRIFADGAVVFSSGVATARPQYIFLGHPADMGNPCAWDSIEIDYVKVESR